MRLKIVGVFASGFLVASLLYFIPPISRLAGNVTHYLSGDHAQGPGIPIVWNDAVQLIEDGHVRSVTFTHDNGKIIFLLDNGIAVEATEPKGGDGSNALETAPNRRWIRIKKF